MNYKTKTGKTFIIKPEKEINRGGEGKIMLVENQSDIVAKIFHIPKNNSFEKKMFYLNKLDKQVFVIPQDLLIQNDEIIGYTMEYVDAGFFSISTFFSKSFCQKNNISLDFKKRIVEKLKFAIQNAHKNNIVIGDMNQFNILVNLKGDLKIIDTDSFASPENIHSGLLLEDVRDYLYNGDISVNSDYFAFSVLTFYLFTFVHPFKGVHKKYKSLKERMINKIPVMVKDSNLTIPNFYESICNVDVAKQFELIFVKGERFLIDIENIDSFSQKIQKIQKSTKLDEKDITVNYILENIKIKNVFFNENFGFVETESLYIIYSSVNRTYLSKKYEINKKDFDKIYIGNENIILQKSEKLYHYKNGNEIIEIKNFSIGKNARIELIGNIIFVIEQDKMFWVFIDEIFNSSIKNQRFEVFGESFSLNNGLIQNIGGTKRIYYNSAKTLSNFKIEKDIKAIIQNKNIGIINYVENKKILTKIFVIRESKIYFYDNTSENFGNLCYKQNTKTDGLIFIPNSKFINILRTEDFTEVSKINCSVINQDTNLFYTKSGLIAYDENNLFLINSKN